MSKQFRAQLVRPRGWGSNPYATRYERHETMHAEPVDYRGVYERREQGKRIAYRACISVKDRTIHLGTFDSMVDAAIAYDDAAVQFHGQKAILNFPSRYGNQFKAARPPAGVPAVVGADRGSGMDGAWSERGGSISAGNGR